MWPYRIIGSIPFLIGGFVSWSYEYIVLAIILFVVAALLLGLLELLLEIVGALD